MIYEKEDNTIFAIEQNVKYKGQHHDELMWAEIHVDKESGLSELRWEDEYNTPLTFSKEKDAKSFVEKYKHLHTPHINGYSYD